MEPKHWWHLFMKTGAPEAYLVYRLECRMKEVADVSENECAGIARSGIS